MWLAYIELFDNKLSTNRLSNNKLPDNNLASELVENRSFFNPITIEEIVIFMIKINIFVATESYYMGWTSVGEWRKSL